MSKYRIKNTIKNKLKTFTLQKLYFGFIWLKHENIEFMEKEEVQSIIDHLEND